MEISFECKKCHRIFDCDVGAVTVAENSNRPRFEKRILCPTCGELTMDEVLLTELGQSQLTEATLDFELDDIFTSEDDELNGFDFCEGECQACGIFTRLNDLGLCEECAEKLERDLIRQQDWNYSALAYGCSESKREELREEIIARHGEKLELIAPKKEAQKKRKKKRKTQRKKGSRIR
jgi:hypothetical protein